MLVFLGAAFFGETWLAGRVYYGGDLTRIYLPLRYALARAVGRGQFPWWSAALGAGYPLIAEGEIGALYPLNWLLARWIPPAWALTFFIVLHYGWSGLGFYRWGRLHGGSPRSALFGACVWALGGLNLAHLSHPSILSVMAWLPWILWLSERLFELPERRWTSVGFLAGAVALQFYAGHAQASLIALLALGMRLAYRGTVERHWRALGYALLGIALGIVLALPQLVPSVQLAFRSQRSLGLDPRFFTSYSFHPFLLATFLSPFVLGNPYPQGSIELMVYVGLLPLALALIALWYGKRHERWFWSGLGLLGVLLGLGRWNPLYGLLQHVPVLSWLRVPARYLYWTQLALAVLAMEGFERLYAVPRRTALWGRVATFGGIGLALGAALLARTALDLEVLIARWQWLPLLWAVVAFVVILGWRYLSPARWAGLACLVLVLDLSTYDAVLDRSFNATVSADQVAPRPEVLPYLLADGEPYRIYVKEEILPAQSVMEASLYPNLNLIYDLPSANVYLPLLPRAYALYLEGLDAERLNRLNVGYYIIPQLLPVDAERELYDVLDPWAALPLDRWISLPMLAVQKVVVESYVSHATHLPDGALAAQIEFRGPRGTWTFPLRVGVETAEWAYARSDVRAQVAHSLPPIAYAFPARSGFPPEPHEGYVYRALARWPVPQQVEAIRLSPALPEAFVRIERVILVDAKGQRHLLSHLVGQGDHQLVYRSQDVVVYRNLDAWPRAYTLPASRISQVNGILSLPADCQRGELGPAQIVGATDGEVLLRATVDRESYLVLADLCYPGWHVTVDGAPAKPLCLDGLWRAVTLSPGAHDVHWWYRVWPW